MDLIQRGADHERQLLLARDIPGARNDITNVTFSSSRPGRNFVIEALAQRTQLAIF